MIKEFEINDILEAVTSIYKMKNKKVEAPEIKNDSSKNKGDLLTKSQVKSDQSKVLVLNEMIE